MSVRTLSKARAMQIASQQTVDYRAKFAALVAEPIERQVEHFIKSFIFALGDDWKTVSAISTKFQDYLKDQNEVFDLDPVQAADFLQKNGKTRTAKERKEELVDIDIDSNNRVGMTEYLLLHYKTMILREYFKRHEMSPTVSLENDGVGLTGVADMLLEELFTMPVGLDPEIEAAIEAFMEAKRKKQEKINELRDREKAGGVKGLAAKNEIAQLMAADPTEENRVELTLKAAQRRASKFSAQEQLEKKKREEEEAIQKKRRDSRTALAAKAAMFNNSSGSSGGGVPRPPPPSKPATTTTSPRAPPPIPSANKRTPPIPPPAPSSAFSSSSSSSADEMMSGGGGGGGGGVTEDEYEVVDRGEAQEETVSPAARRPPPPPQKSGSSRIPPPPPRSGGGTIRTPPAPPTEASDVQQPSVLEQASSQGYEAQEESAWPCDNYTEDTFASEFEMCTCGHKKSDHQG